MHHGFVAPVALVAALITFGALPIHRVEWFARAPRLGIALWMAMTGAAAATLGTLPVLIAMHLPSAGEAVAHLYTGCFHILMEPGTSAGWRAVVVVFAVAGLTPAVWIVWQVGSALLGARRRRETHLQRVMLVASDVVGDTVVVDDQRPAIYSVGGGGGAIVITRGALDRLTGEEFSAACAHERAHLRERHHLLTGIADGLARAVPRLAICQAAQVEIRRLIELRADDVALRRHPRHRLVQALSAVTCSAPDDVDRWQRANRSPVRPGRVAQSVVVMLTIGLVALPPLLMARTVVGHLDSCDSPSPS